jgi:hypothetical protein
MLEDDIKGVGVEVMQSHAGGGAWPWTVEKTADYVQELCMLLLERFVAEVVGFRDELVEVSRGMSEHEIIANEAMTAAQFIMQILMGRPGICRCWLGTNEVKRAKPPAGTGNMARKYLACRERHNLRTFDPDGKLTPEEFLSKAVTGSPDRTRIGTKSIPSGLFWYYWLKHATAEHMGLLLMMRKVVRRLCPECGEHRCGRYCSNGPNCHRRDLSANRPCAANDFIVMDRSFERRLAYICHTVVAETVRLQPIRDSGKEGARRRWECDSVFFERPADGVCLHCGGKVSAKASAIYTMRSIPLMGWALPRVVPAATEVDEEEATALVIDVESIYGRVSWQCRAIRYFLQRSDRELSPDELHAQLGDQLGCPPTAADLCDWCQQQITRLQDEDDL